MNNNTALEMEIEDNPIVVDEYGVFEEEVIDTFHDGSTVLATITRNWYGALVLNTRKVMFVDVDLAPRQSFSGNAPSFATQLAAAQRSPTVQQLRADALLERFDVVAEQNPELGFEVYRTAAGFRLIINSREFDPSEPDTERIFKALDADPIYATLCQKQQCFRARISPKPWRIGMRTEYPCADEDRRAWTYCYDKQAAEFAVCESIGAIGRRDIPDTVQAITELHERLTIQHGARLA
jgi:hypothetical protein